MMTGDLILHLSRTPQSSGLIQPHAKKADSLRDSPKHALSSYGIDNGKRKNGAAKAAPHAKYDSSLSSSNSLSEEEVSIESVKKSTAIGGATSHQNTSPSHNAAYGTYNVKQKHHQQQSQQPQQPIVDYNNSKDNNLQQINKLERNSHSDIVINKSNSRNLNNDILDMDSINDSSSSGSYPNKDSVGGSGGGGGGSNSLLDEELLLSSGQSQEVKSELVKNLHNIKQKSYENDDDVDCYLQKSAGPVIAAKYSDKQRRQLSQPQRSESLSSSSSTNRGGGGSSSSSHDAGDDEDDISYSVPTSPTSLTTPILQDSCCCTAKKKRDLVQAISAPTSPETSSGGMGAVPATASQDLIRRSCSSSQNHTQNGEFNKSYYRCFVTKRIFEISRHHSDL
jgi:PH and SEC7 domain-containing protein